MRRLLIRPGAIGDSILCLPAMQALRSGYTEVWVPRPVVPLIRFADRVRPIAATGLDLVGIGIDTPPRTLELLGGFDEIVSWYGANRQDFQQAVRGLPFRFLRALPPDDEGLHAADFFLRQIGGTGTSIPRIECAPLPDAGEFAVIHPFSGSARKNWPLERFHEVADRLPMPVRWCAGPEEALPQAVRFDNLYELGRWMASARVYIGNDSGITHLAAAVGAPTVAIFTATDPAIWGPRGPKVRILTGCPTAEDVVSAVQMIRRG
ncbi:MAG TPA: glycosyltransferase family 9 protein [Bryobacteraceae bacterium]|nr:glycosyltransferase family 9 protein [Bryobacteraceae bacterium]